MLHVGHFLLFKHARELGDKLIVAVQTDDYVLKFKPEAKIINPMNDRMFMVGSIRYVDQVIDYRDVSDLIKEVDFDVFAKGPDQNHDGFQRAMDWCKSNGKEVCIIPRTEGISSTDLRDYLERR